jgi:hypothetical protein
MDNLIKKIFEKRHAEFNEIVFLIDVVKRLRKENEEMRKKLKQIEQTTRNFLPL